MNTAVVKIWSLIREGYFMKFILYAEHIAENDTKTSAVTTCIRDTNLKILNMQLESSFE